mgnify:CR=1 FL=1
MARPDPWRLDPSTRDRSTDIQTRFQDMDINGHLNNVAFAALFESARVMLNRRVRPWADRPGNERTMVAEVTITYLAEGHFPGEVTLLSGIGRVGSRGHRAARSGERTASPCGVHGWHGRNGGR